MKKQDLEKLVSSMTEELTKVSTAISSFKDEVTKIAQRVEVLEKPIEKKQVMQVTATMTSSPAYPVPTEYRQIVDTVLNKNFGIECTPLADRPGFEFVVLVPKEYSNASAPHWQTYGSDRRPRVLTYAEGVNGVREWVQKVYNNLDQDTRTRIGLDRI